MNNIEEQAKELLNKISSKVEEVTRIAPSRVSKSDKLKRWSAFIRVESPREEFLWSLGYPDDHGVSAIRIGTWVSQPSSDKQAVYDALETMLTNQLPEHTVDRNEKGIALEIKLNTKADSQKLDENLLKIAHTIQDLIPAFYELIDGKIVFNRSSGGGSESKTNETNNLTPEQSNFLEEGFWWGDLEDEEKVPKAWLMNKNFMLQAVTSDGRALEYASDELKSDREIILEALKSSEDNLMYASASFLNEYYNESSLYDWNYENKDSEQEFFEWLNNFEMPDEEIDYVLTYKRIYDDVDKFVAYSESTYTDIMKLNKSLLEEGAIEVYDNLDADIKERCIEEGYEDDPLGAFMDLGYELGGEGGAISSPDFIKHFTSLEDQRNVLGLYLASLVKYLWSDMGNDWDSAPSYWEGYQIKKDDW